MDIPDLPTPFMTTIDLSLPNPLSNDLPAWLRDVLDRALSATGIRIKRRLALEEAIEHLTEVDLDDLEDKTCPICFESYEKSRSSDCQLEKLPSKSSSETPSAASGVNDLGFCKSLHKHGIDNIQSLHQGLAFNDPSLFLPADESAAAHARFPVRNLYSLQEVTEDDILPGSDRNLDRPDLLKKEYSHVPVRMPSCNHVFGQSCIVEWLRSNVSCPLCRKEVESQAESDPKVLRLAEITARSRTVFNRDSEAMVDHLANHLTDVFNPYRRPINPAVTPLTDSYVHQDWAAVHDSGVAPVAGSEPNLVFPRRFPIPDINSLPVFAARRARRELNRNRDTARTARENAAAEDLPETVPIPEEPQVADIPSSMEATPAPSGQEDAFTGITFDITVPEASVSEPSSVRVPVRGRGGPERSRRGTPPNRAHPYSRPQSEDPSPGP